jgi:hypothetical protein
MRLVMITCYKLSINTLTILSPGFLSSGVFGVHKSDHLLAFVKVLNEAYVWKQ